MNAFIATNRSKKGSAQISRSTAAVIALIQAGITDYAVIARAARLTVNDVQQIDAATDGNVRCLAVQGVPRDAYYHLHTKVTCPGCGRAINLVPCVACAVARVGR